MPVVYLHLGNGERRLLGLLFLFDDFDVIGNAADDVTEDGEEHVDHGIILRNHNRVRRALPSELLGQGADVGLGYEEPRLAVGHPKEGVDSSLKGGADVGLGRMDAAEAGDRLDLIRGQAEALDIGRRIEFEFFAQLDGGQFDREDGKILPAGVDGQFALGITEGNEGRQRKHGVNGVDAGLFALLDAVSGCMEQTFLANRHHGIFRVKDRGENVVLMALVCGGLCLCGGGGQFYHLVMQGTLIKRGLQSIDGGGQLGKQGNGVLAEFVLHHYFFSFFVGVGVVGVVTESRKPGTSKGRQL